MLISHRPRNLPHGEIARRLAEVYATEISEQTITAITGKHRGAQNALFGVTSIATATGGSSAHIDAARRAFLLSFVITQRDQDRRGSPIRAVGTRVRARGLAAGVRWWRRTLAGSGKGGVGDDLAFVVMAVRIADLEGHLAGMLLRSCTVALLLIEDPPTTCLCRLGRTVVQDRRQGGCRAGVKAGRARLCCGSCQEPVLCLVRAD